MEFEDVSERVEWEVKRVAAAFRLEKWGTFGVVDEGVLVVDDGWSSGEKSLSGFSLTWCIDHGMIREISVYDREENHSLAILKLFRGYGGRFKEWRYTIQVTTSWHAVCTALVSRTKAF